MATGDKIILSVDTFVTVENTLTSTSTVNALAAAQGKSLKDTADTLAGTVATKADASTAVTTGSAQALHNTDALRIADTTLSLYKGSGAFESVEISAGAEGGGTDKVFFHNDTNVTTSFTLTAGRNAVSAGPITIDDGAVISVPDGSTWSIV